MKRKLLIILLCGGLGFGCTSFVNGCANRPIEKVPLQIKFEEKMNFLACVSAVTLGTQEQKQHAVDKAYASLVELEKYPYLVECLFKKYEAITPTEEDYQNIQSIYDGLMCAG